MDTNTAPKLTFSQRALLDKIGRVLKKAKRRGVIPFYKTYWRSEVAFLETQGWKVHSHTPLSYGAAESWTLTLA